MLRPAARVRSGCLDGSGGAQPAQPARCQPVPHSAKVRHALTAPPELHHTHCHAGAWEVLAGQDGRAGARDGPRGTSLLNRPSALCVNPLGLLVVADTGNACLRQVDAQGAVTTLAGVCNSTGGRDGSGASALYGDRVRSVVCLADCGVLVGDEANGRLR